MCSTTKAELTDEEVCFFCLSSVLRLRAPTNAITLQIQDLMGKISDFMSQPEHERDYEKMMSDLNQIGDFTHEEDERVKQIFGTDVEDLERKFQSGSLDYVTLMKKLSFGGKVSATSDMKSYDPESGSNGEENSEVDDPEMDEWLNRAFKPSETDPRELVKNHNIPFPSHDPDYNATAKFQKTVEDFKVASELLKMNPLPGTKSQLPDDARLREKGKNLMALEGLGGFSKTDGSSANMGSGRGRGGRLGGVFDGADKKSEGFGDLSSSDVQVEDLKNVPAVFFEDASKEANESILRLLHNVRSISTRAQHTSRVLLLFFTLNICISIEYQTRKLEYRSILGTCESGT